MLILLVTSKLTLYLQQKLAFSLILTYFILGLTLENEGNAGKFKKLITKLAQENKVVVLIDEYDAPIINN